MVKVQFLNKMKQNQLQFIYRFGRQEMNQELYLQKLRNIREKYTSVGKSLLGHKNSDFSYRQYAANPEHFGPKQTIQMASTPYESHRIPLSLTKPERSFSLVDRSPIIPNDSIINAYEPSQKRMDNFSAFIKDLDQRIQEKEKALRSKFRPLQQPRSREDVEYDVMRTLNRYNSSKDIGKSNLPQVSEAISRVAPREAYERSLSKRDEVQAKRVISNYEIQNLLEKKWTQENSNEKSKVVSGYGARLKINSQYTSPLGISKQQNLPICDNWSFGKLDNIQKRIKAVLG